MQRYSLVTAFFMMLFGTLLSAQGAPIVAPGQRVRVESASVRGEFTVLRMSGDTLMLVDARGRNADPVPLSSISKLELHRGKRPGRNAVKFGLVAAGVGASIGAIAFMEGGEGCGFYEIDCVETSTGETAAVVGPIALGLAGGVIGVLFARRRADIWERVIAEPARAAP